MNWDIILLPSGIIMFIANTFWMFAYPSIVWESLTFRNDDGIKGHLISIANWIWLIGGTWALVKIIALLSN